MIRVVTASRRSFPFPTPFQAPIACAVDGRHRPFKVKYVIGAMIQAGVQPPDLATAESNANVDLDSVVPKWNSLYQNVTDEVDGDRTDLAVGDGIVEDGDFFESVYRVGGGNGYEGFSFSRDWVPYYVVSVDASCQQGGGGVTESMFTRAVVTSRLRQSYLVFSGERAGLLEWQQFGSQTNLVKIGGGVLQKGEVFELPAPDSAFAAANAGSKASKVTFVQGLSEADAVALLS